jgi:YbbR domain-containing protein
VDKDFPIQIDVVGIPESGYVVGEYSTSPTTLKVTGAENVISQIAYVEVSYNVESMNADVSDSVKPVFYDSEGKIVKSDKLELSRSDVQLQIEILPTKWIKVNYVVSGTPAEGYSLSGYTENLTSINVAARKDHLANVSAIDIPSGVVDITGATGDKKIAVSLAPYLPSGFRIVSSMTVLEVQTTIEKISDGIVNIPVEDIEITGVAENYSYEITTVDGDAVLEVGVKGVEEVINNITIDELNPSVNLTGKKEGVHTIKVTLNAQEAYTIAKTYYVKVTLTDMNAEEETEAVDATVDSEKK